MIYLLPIGMIVLTGTVALLYGSRGAQLKNMARNLHLRYDPQTENPLTQEAAKQVRLFNRGLHQFFHVLTWKDPGAFIRLCDDNVFTSPFDKAPSQQFTLATAELTRGQFIPFVLMPRTEKTAKMHPALPPELAARYTLAAPENYRFPSGVLGLLKAGAPCYMETTQDTLVYHEFTTATLDQIQPLHFRARQFVQELRRAETPVGKVNAPTKTEAEVQAEVLLKLQMGPQAHTRAPDSARLMYGLILLVFLGAMCLLAWFALQRVAAR